MLYNMEDGSFITIPDQQHLLYQDPPDNCPVCLISEQKQEEAFPNQIKDGLAIMGQTYHLNDFVLVKSEACPHKEPPNICDACKRVQPGTIGQIIRLKWSKHPRHSDKNHVTIRLLGRIGELTGVEGYPKDIVRDEVGG